MKKKLLLVVLAVLTLLVLAACSPTPADNNTDNPDEQNIQEEAITPSVMAVSYTHLDVYKRQAIYH